MRITINDKVFVACICQSTAEHELGSLLDSSLTDCSCITSETQIKKRFCESEQHLGEWLFSLTLVMVCIPSILQDIRAAVRILKHVTRAENCSVMQ